MKRILLAVLIMIAAIPHLFAAGYRSLVKLRLSDNTPIMVSIDGRNFYNQGRTLTIGNMPPGRHRMKVYAVGDYGRRRRTLVYEGFFKIAPNTNNYIVVDRFRGTVRINTGMLENFGPRDKKEVHVYNQRNDGYDDNYGQSGEVINDWNMNDNDDSRFNSKNDWSDKYDNDKDEKWNDRDDRDNRRREMLSQRDMEDIKRRIESRVTDSDKLKFMKSVVSDKSYTTEQVRTMIKWLVFDNSRLEFAKAAYDNVSDKREYWKLDNEFSFGSSKDDFNDFLRKRR
jgi:hypothetical protein